MFLVYIDHQLAYSSEMTEEEGAIGSPRIKLEVNTNGSFDFVIHPTHYLYDQIHKMRSIVQVLWDGVEIFYGRVLNTEVSMYKEKSVSCEGALGFLNDSVQAPLKKGSKHTVSDLVSSIIAEHNKQITDHDRQFKVGTITIGGSESYAFERTSYENSRSCIDNILELLDGYIRVRHESDGLYLDFLDDYEPTVNQSITFGINLADISISDQAEDLFTSVLPVGKNNLTIPESSGGPILDNNDLVALYGRIIRPVSFDNVTKAADLIQNGSDYLQKNAANIPTRYDVKALDLHYFDPEKDLLLPGYTVPLESEIHDLDEDQLICISCELDLQNPENNSYVIGIPDPYSGSGSKGYSNGSTTITSTVKTVKKAAAEEAANEKNKYDLLEIEANRIAVKTDELEIDLRNTSDAIYSRITATKEEIQTEVANKEANLQSTISQTASSIRSEVSDSANNLSSKITQTAKEIRAEVSNKEESLNSKITQTAEEIRSEVTNVEGGLVTRITQTANQLRSEAKSTKEGLESSITQTAAQIRSEVKDTKSGLESSITQLSDSLELKVGKGEIASSINVTDQSVQISASKIDLGGYVTAYELSTTKATINNLTNGVTTASQIKCTSFSAGTATINTVRVSGTLVVGGRNATWARVQTADGGTRYALCSG